MTPEQFGRVGELYHAASELAPEARPDFLAEACAGEDELRREVESLLQAHEQVDDFIAGKAAVVAELAAQHQNLSLSSLSAPSLAPSLIGHSVSHYQVLSLLGAGGMGEVYLAQDTRLRRRVALKLLPQAYAHNQEWLRRFEREALATSALNHPNILTVYDIGTTSTELGGGPFIVAELLEGAELRQQMKDGPLPVRKAIDYARQIAAGLAAAHEKGIVHRDLKPENLFVTKDGLVKVLDFGLAKLSPQHSERSGPSLTTQKQITNPGTVMGTVGYMSPEQVRGQEANHHSDIFAFGLILYEMLAGRRPFQGESSAETMAAIVNQEAPEISEINSKIPLQLERIVSHCLEKQPARRFQTASDLGFALEALLTPSGSRLKEETASSATQTINELPRWIGSEKWWIVVTALAMVLAAGFAGAYFIRPSVPDAQPMKLALMLSEKTKFNHLAVSPDGAWLAFTTETGGVWKLWALALATGEARPLEGAEGAKHPFWSPDSRFIGFFTSDKLKKIALNGGLPVTLCDFPSANCGTWNRDGVIIFATLDGGELYRVSATGGPVVNILQNDLKREELVLRFPSFLPDGHHFLYSVASNNKEVRGIYLGSLDGGTRERLLGDYSNAIYVASGRGRNDSGYLLFGHEKVLMAQPFDARTLRLGGEPVSVAGQIGTVVNSVQRNFSASIDGVLVFDPVPNRQHKQLLWVDRAGKTINTLKQFDDPRVAMIAPNGKHFVVTNYDLPTNNFDLWLSDITDSNAVRLTFDPRNDSFPIWSPDASRIAWSATREKDKFIQIYQKPVNRTGQETLLSQSEYNKTPTDWSRDGRYIIYRQDDPKTKNDIWALPLFGEQKPFPLLQSAANEGAGSLSSDGRWLAYHSDESGRYEIYVQSFLDGSSKHRVSTGGGVWPQWRGDGKELYYRAPDDTLMAAPVMSQTSLTGGTPVVLFAFRTGGHPDQPYYSADRGGQRFLLNTIVESETNSPLTVLVNWMAVMKK